MFPHAGIRIGKLFGIQLSLDFSLLLIFLLITFNLAAGVFPQWHPDWGPGLRWGLAAVATCAFFLTILAHELSHALVAKGYGLRVRSITLFLFGGLANIELDPDTPKKEALMALVGPVTSLALGFCFLLVSNAIVAAQGDLMTQVGVEQWLRQMGPTQTLLAWLGPMNILVGVFNLLPGFPLDGGRILRALLWRITHDLQRATRWASSAGQMLGWAFVLLGISMAFGLRVPLFGTGFIAGLWLVLIGLFLSNVAAMSYRQLLIRNVMQGVSVANLMRQQLHEPVSASAPITQFIDEAVSSGDSLFPVASAGRIVGVVWASDVKQVARDRWPHTTVGEIATCDLSQVPATEPTDDAFQLLQRLSQHENWKDPILVMRDSEVVGTVGRNDILRWLELHSAKTTHTPTVRSVLHHG